MTESLTYVQSLTVADGPSLSKTATIAVDAIDIVNAIAPKSTGSPVPVTIDVQPSTASMMSVLFITSDNYTSLTYSVDAVGVSHDLDGPQLFMGGQIDLLGGGKKLIFTNAGTAKDAAIKIFVGRTAME
jgi:hypothetical protein